MLKLKTLFCFLLLCCLVPLQGCNSDSSITSPNPTPPSTPTPPSNNHVSDEAAVRFLMQSTFGPTDQSVDEVTALGYEKWLDAQFLKTGGKLLTYVDDYVGGRSIDAGNEPLQGAWWRASVTNPDQLRQRVAFALSQIFVVSTDGNQLSSQRFRGVANYYDMLADNAFGNFRTLLEDVTLHPMMGRYLSMYKNRKPNAAKLTHPDENYAREVMQLFSIGLVELNQDGSPELNAQGKPIPTYTQQDIEGLAHVFTGWTDAGANAKGTFNPGINVLQPMEAWAPQHDSQAKTIVRGIQISSGLSAEQELKIALDTLFNHPNVAPFIGKQLIQRLTHSNPSRAYIARVSAVFNDNGKGVRGDLKAVVRAILLDDEARADGIKKLKEPTIRNAALWRVFDATSVSGNYGYLSGQKELGQGALNSESVFNFYRPDYKRSGALQDNNVSAPEFQITNESQMTLLSNRLLTHIKQTNSHPNKPSLNLTKLLSMAGDSRQLMDYLDLMLTASSLSDTAKNIIIQHLNTISGVTDEGKTNRVTDAIYLVMTQAEQAAQ